MITVKIGRSVKFNGIKFYFDYEEYSVPINTEKPSQHRSSTAYVNRMISQGNRTRGDVLV